jgi:hypothetical protein
MSDFYTSAIPTEVTWQPTSEAAAEAEAYLRRVFPDPDGVGQEVLVWFYDRVTAVDAGENLVQISCPRCDGDIPIDWYDSLIEETKGKFETLDVTVSCCGAMVSLDTLRFDWSSGFARFEIAVRNPARAEYEFTSEELHLLAAILGHPVRQILAHI